MMNIHKASLLAAGVLLSALAGPSLVMAASDQTTVTITGTVLDNTCTLTGSEEGLSFALSPVSVRDFGDAVGSPVEEVVIPVEFKDCGGGTKGVTVKVSGESAGSTSAFKNTLDGDTSSDGASGVGINFYDTDGTLIPSGSDASAKEQTFGSEGITLNYKASYTKVADEVKAGQLNTVITLYFTYV